MSSAIAYTKGEQVNTELFSGVASLQSQNVSVEMPHQLGCISAILF